MRLSRCAWQVKISLTARLLLALCALLLPCLAQEPTAILVGRITDASGGVAPNVAVDILNVETGVKWQVKTNASGYYTEPLLPPGNYQVTTQLEGFRPVTRTLTLVVDQIARLDFALEVGAVTETIVVTGAPPVLENGSASIGQVISAQIRSLPLNGRNYLDLAKMAMGVGLPSGTGLAGTAGDRAKNGGAFVANGVRSDMNNFVLDGVDNNAKIPDLSSNSNIIISPSVDAIQEFKVETNNFSAEYGYSAGAIVNATIKNGTNQFHGTAFEFLRNDSMDARDFFSLPTQPKPILQRNQYGGVLGGPVIKNKTFFFGSWEGTRFNQGIPQVNTLPSDAQRLGNFSSGGAKPIFDPNSLANNPAGAGFVRTAFPGNTIPASQIDPRSAKIAALIPAADAAGVANNFVDSPVNVDKRNQFDFRGDQNFSDKDKLYARYSYYTLNYVTPGPFPAPLIGSSAFQTSNNQQSGHEAALGETHLFSSSLINEFRAGYNRISNQLLPFVNTYVDQQFGFVNIPQEPGVTGLPNITVSGYSNLGEAAFLPDAKGSDTFMATNSLLWTKGNHFIKIGGTYRWVRSRFNIAGNARGSFTFDGVFTQNPQSRGNSGNAFADYLLGDADNGTLTSVFIGDLRYKYYGAYINDDWKVAPHLTLNLGIRYEIWTPTYERHDLQANFLLGTDKLIYPNNKVPAGVPASLVTTIPSGVDSRGLTDFHKNNWSPRLGLAWQVASHTVIRAGAGIFYAEPDAGGASGRPVANPPFRITTTYPTDQAHSNLTFASGFPAGALSLTTVDPTATTFVAYDPNLAPAYVFHWSGGVQHQIGNFLLDANYVGTKGTHLSTGYDANTDYPGGTSVAARRPVQGFGSLTYLGSMGNSEYNGLQMRIERHFSSGFAILTSYTFAKSIDLSGGQLLADIHLRDVSNVSLERALSSSDQTHRLVVGYMYDLPFGRGQRFNITNPVLNQIAGNWQVNGITTVQTGLPFTPQLGSSTANTGDPRPNRYSNGNLSSDQRAVNHWFDTAAFLPTPTPYLFGNAGRDIIFAPGAVNFDFSAFKRFLIKQLGEAGEVQFRAELFNALNHPQYAQPSPRVDIPAGGTITSLVTPMRTIQLGLKVIF